MACVTVEDCLDNVDNRSEPVMLAVKYARRLAIGSREPKAAQENDKPTIVVLRETASGLVDENVVQQEDIAGDGPLFAVFDDEANTEVL